MDYFRDYLSWIKEFDLKNSINFLKGFRWFCMRFGICFNFYRRCTLGRSFKYIIKVKGDLLRDFITNTSIKVQE